MLNSMALGDDKEAILAINSNALNEIYGCLRKLHDTA